MWLFTNHGFYSIVKILDTNPEEFWIRSRRKEHLTTYFSEERIIYTHATDYQYRVTIKLQCPCFWIYLRIFRGYV